MEVTMTDAYVPPAPVEIEDFTPFLDESGNWVTPQLVAYEKHAWQAEVSAFERMTGVAAFPALGVAPVDPFPETIDKAYPKPPEDAAPVEPGVV